MEHRAGPAFARAAAQVLAALELPDPAPGEYLEGNEARQIFLDDYGLVIRAGRRLNVPENQLILAPLRATPPVRHRGALHVLELMPGIRAGLEDATETYDVHKSLRACGIDYWDAQSANGGYLPIRDEYYPNGIPVVLDRGAVRRGLEPGAMQKFRPVSYRGTQADIYAPLLKKLARGWPASAPLPLRPLRAFLRACREDIEGRGQSLLSNRWCRPAANDDGAGSSESGWYNGPYLDKARLAAEAGAAYALRLRAQKHLPGAKR
jgi:hypothetical protein